MKNHNKKWMTIIEVLTTMTVSILIITALTFWSRNRNMWNFVSWLNTKIQPELVLNNSITNFNISENWWTKLEFIVWNDFILKSVRNDSLSAYETESIELEWKISLLQATFQKEIWKRDIEVIDYKTDTDTFEVLIDSENWVTKMVNWREALWVRLFLKWKNNIILTFSL